MLNLIKLINRNTKKIKVAIIDNNIDVKWIYNKTGNLMNEYNVCSYNENNDVINNYSLHGTLCVNIFIEYTGFDNLLGINIGMKNLKEISVNK